ncbi:hypothetical protein BDQ12DRAFT_217642 [Crucibulum laeve]|uniref:Uncharacterized protein n=1 Tax=Crucibulum laeve TaxID=68775 RepID=A0A5C3LHA1_9AGAR|nr:hypothetical protein BDQ12DRAFT_217642 [Crucibulum laeve]
MPTMVLFLRDGVVWFVAVFVFSTAQVLIVQKADRVIANVLTVPSIATYCIAASRVMLNIKRVVYTIHVDDEDADLSNYSVTEFRARTAAGSLDI